MAADLSPGRTVLYYMPAMFADTEWGSDDTIPTWTIRQIVSTLDQAIMLYYLSNNYHIHMALWLSLILKLE